VEAAVPVLVVDDNPTFLRVVRAILAPRFAVHTVETGMDAVAFLEGRAPFTDAPRPAFVLLDFHLPDIDAPDVLHRLAARDDLRAIPVLVLSQADWEEDEAAARAAGAVHFQVKPSRVQPLRDTIVAFWKEHVHADRRDPARRG
jgi:CheY-like chemotaxis protein